MESQNAFVTGLCKCANTYRVFEGHFNNNKKDWIYKHIILMPESTDQPRNIWFLIIGILIRKR